jgi:hypothetical protein
MWRVVLPATPAEPDGRITGMVNLSRARPQQKTNSTKGRAQGPRPGVETVGDSMTAPTRRPDDRPVMPSRPPPAVYVMNDEDGNWVVIRGNHSWVHADLWSALTDAREIAQGALVRVSS